MTHLNVILKRERKGDSFCCKKTNPPLRPEIIPAYFPPFHVLNSNTRRASFCSFHIFLFPPNIRFILLASPPQMGAYLRASAFSPSPPHPIPTTVMFHTLAVNKKKRKKQRMDEPRERRLHSLPS